jgi:hypothetical protein
MRSIFRVSLTMCAAVIFSTLVRADDEADAKALLDKAIKARGGADTLSKFKASTVKMKGKYYGMGDGIDFTLERSSQFPDRSRVEISGEANGQKFSFTQILQGDKGWNASEGASQELSKDSRRWANPKSAIRKQSASKSRAKTTATSTSISTRKPAC